MHTTYHLASAQEISIDTLNAIKTTFKSKPITIGLLNYRFSSRSKRN